MSSSSKGKVAHDTLCKFIQITLQKNNQNTLTRLISELDCITSYKPESICKWYLALCDCISLLQLDRNRNLWCTIFEKFRWDFPKKTLDAYSKFCLLLISNNPAAIKPVLQSCTANLIDRFIPDKYPSNITIPDDIRYGMIHKLLQQIHNNIPTMSGVLINCLIDLFPNIYSADVLSSYVSQLLIIIQYIPELKSQIIQLIIEKMIIIDAEIINDNNINNDIHIDTDNDDNEEDDDDLDIDIDISSSDDDDDVDDDKEDEYNILVTNLDSLMCIMFEYIRDNKCLLNDFYNILSRIFESTILSTNNISSIQFLMFYLCSFRTQYAEEFVSRLMRLCTDTTRQMHIRCFAAGYVGGYVSKAKYLRHTSSFNSFIILTQWLTAYIQLYKERFPFVSTVGATEAKNHALFYSVCQAVLRIYTHHQHTFDSMGDHSKIPNAIYQITRSCLQPLKYCNGLLVINFLDSISESSIMDISLFPAFGSSSNLCLSSSTFTNWNLFPFDSYSLYNSSEYLNGLFRIKGCQSPLRKNENNNTQFDYISSNNIDPSNALTPSLCPTDKNDNQIDDDLDNNMLNLNDEHVHDDDNFLI